MIWNLSYSRSELLEMVSLIYPENLYIVKSSSWLTILIFGVGISSTLSKGSNPIEGFISYAFFSYVSASSWVIWNCAYFLELTRGMKVEGDFMKKINLFVEVSVKVSF